MTPEQFEQRLGQLRARHALLKRGVLTCPRGVKRVVKLYKGIQALDAPRLLGFSEHTFDRYRKVAESPFLQRMLKTGRIPRAWKVVNKWSVGRTDSAHENENQEYLAAAMAKVGVALLPVPDVDEEEEDDEEEEEAAEAAEAEEEEGAAAGANDVKEEWVGNEEDAETVSVGSGGEAEEQEAEPEAVGANAAAAASGQARVRKGVAPKRNTTRNKRAAIKAKGGKGEYLFIGGQRRFIKAKVKGATREKKIAKMKREAGEL